MLLINVISNKLLPQYYLFCKILRALMYPSVLGNNLTCVFETRINRLYSNSSPFTEIYFLNYFRKKYNIHYTSQRQYLHVAHQNVKRYNI